MSSRPNVEEPPAGADDEAWLAEIKRRADRVRRGESRADPWSVVRDALLDELRERYVESETGRASRS